MAQAIEDAALDGADIINLSLVLGFDSPTIEGAVNLAASQGVLMVTAAGNAGIGTVYWPAHYPEVVAVATLNVHDQRTSYSNYGPEIEIAAPGGDAAQQVFSTWSKDAYFVQKGDANDPNDDVRVYRYAEKDRQFSGGGEYCTRYGTSQATPAVAGAAALLLSVNPTLTITNVRQILANTAAPLDEGAEYVGAGKLDVLAALRTQLPNALVVSPASTVRTVLNTADPFTVTVRVDNPSLKPIAWTGALESSLLAAEGGAITPTTWITLTSGVSNTQSATTAFGAPDFLSLLIAPTTVMSGMYEASLVFTATTSLGPVTQRTGVLLTVTEDPDVTPAMRFAYLPMVMGQGVESANVPFTWAEPAIPGDRVMIPLTDTSAYTLSQLPVAITIGSQHHQPAARLLGWFRHGAGCVRSPRAALPAGGQSLRAQHGHPGNRRLRLVGGPGPGRHGRAGLDLPRRQRPLRNRVCERACRRRGAPVYGELPDRAAPEWQRGAELCRDARVRGCA